VSLRRSIAYAGLTFSLAALAFSFGSWTAERSIAQQLARNDARVSALRDDMARAILQIRQTETAATPSGTNGQRQPEVVPAGGTQPALIEEIKRQLQSEMGLMPVRLLRDRKDSFVELNAYDATGKSSYGTAGYLGNGYFVTVKHAVVALDDEEGREGHKITSIKVRVHGRDMTARLVDAGDADVEVHAGDWAVIRVSQNVDLPPLRVNTNFSYDFADPIFRLGNDYSKGIILSTGYVGQRTPNGLVTALTDGHPGVSGGGVLDQDGDLVGIPIGRMQGDYRFSFILPVRGQMFRKVPGVTVVESKVASATN
jgi:S1-C subfamily serine protease